MKRFLLTVAMAAGVAMLVATPASALRDWLKVRIAEKTGVELIPEVRIVGEPA